jgi:hypothetical protein
VHGADVRAVSAVTMLLSLLVVQVAIIHIATIHSETLRRSVLKGVVYYKY